MYPRLTLLPLSVCRLVLEKMCESIASRSVIGDMKKSAEKHLVAAERFQKKITYLQKQVRDLWCAPPRSYTMRDIHVTPNEVGNTGLQITSYYSYRL